MLSATVSRRLEALEDISKQEKRINGLFRLMEDQLLWHEAYANIYANRRPFQSGDKSSKQFAPTMEWSPLWTIRCCILRRSPVTADHGVSVAGRALRQTRRCGRH